MIKSCGLISSEATKCNPLLSTIDSLLFCFLKRKLLQVSIQLITTGEAGYQPTGEADYQYAEVDSKPTHEQSVYHNYHTLEPDSASQENQPQYEVPVPQQHNVHMSNEVGKICKDYETLHNEWLYISLCRDMQHATVGGFTFRQR